MALHRPRADKSQRGDHLGSFYHAAGFSHSRYELLHGREEFFHEKIQKRDRRRRRGRIRPDRHECVATQESLRREERERRRSAPVHQRNWRHEGHQRYREGQTHGRQSSQGQRKEQNSLSYKRCSLHDRQSPK